MTTFKSDDGREITEADVRIVALDWHGNTDVKTAARRILIALDPKPAPTCGAKLYALTNPPNAHLPCVLPPPVNGFHEGHHAYVDGGENTGRCIRTLFIPPSFPCCLLPESDPVHSVGHQVAAECWVMP